MNTYLLIIGCHGNVNVHGDFYMSLNKILYVLTWTVL